MLKLLVYTFILSKCYILMNYSIKLVSHWVKIFSDRNWKHRHEDFQVMFRIVLLISNCPQKQLSPEQLTIIFTQKKSYRQIRKYFYFFKKTGNGMQTSCSPYFMFGAVYCLLQEVSRPKSKAKATLKNSSLKRTMTSSFRKALL